MYLPKWLRSLFITDQTLTFTQAATQLIVSELGERECNKLMYTRTKSLLGPRCLVIATQGVIRFRAKCRENRASRMLLFFSNRDIQCGK